MHIPDGYLSPVTCVSLYGAAIPFWTTALRRLKRVMHTRAIPLVSVFSAFCFVIMMFNLPLPGGTTGHAVGMGAAAIVLGPWASIVAISMALLVQAFFFGDGGITALGANCFNMAIAGSLVSYAVYRLLAGHSALCSKRRLLSAGLAGYAGINISALLAAIEFGVQPLLFHDASGAPLYAPYPLSIALPAMMIGHLTFAGMAEFVISSGIVGWLQKVDPEMLRVTAGNTAVAETRTVRKLWIGLAVLLVLTPLGILAVGSAWGEWSAQDFSDARARSQIAAASGNNAAPARAPGGLERLSSLWTAPLARYAPAFVPNEKLGYLFSAAAGVVVIAALGALLGRLWQMGAGRRRRSFVEKTTRGLLGALQESLFAEEMAQKRGFLQLLDARVKLAGFGALIVAAVCVHRISVLAALFAVAVLLAAGSRIPLRVLTARVWLTVMAFTGLIALPAIFLTAGETVFRLPLLPWNVTYQGVRSAAFLILRAETTATFSVLLILTTLWTQLLRALRFFHLPVVLVVVAGMTYRYIFLLLRTATEIFEAREARMIGRLQPADQRRLATASAGVLLGKTMQLTGDIHLAMQARGFRGEVRLLDDVALRAADWLRLSAFAGIAAGAVWWGW
jgi:cobalt/nickel transport system permease protein